MRSGQQYSSPRSFSIIGRLTPAAAAAALAAVTVACGGTTAVETVVGPDAVRCQTTVAGQPTTVPADGGSVNVTISAARDCTWTASSDATWMQLSATSGQGNSTLAVTVARNAVPSSRSGAVTVNDQRLTVTQEARPCTYEIRASRDRMDAAGGRGTVSVDTLTGCSWTAASSTPWLRVLTPSGSGSGTVEFEVLPNEGGPREGSITIGGRSLTIEQTGVNAPQPPPQPNCTFALSPGTISVAAAGGTHSASMTAGPSCEWMTSSTASWLSVSPATGRGNGTITMVAARNTGAARSATVTTGGQTVTVNQEAAPVCTFSIDPRSGSYPASGGEGRVRVTTQTGCEWSTSGGASWTQVSNGRGTGSGEARYTVSANSSTSARSTTLTIAGQSHSVSQQGAAPTCTYSIDPSSRAFGAGGGEGRFTVTTQAGCSWNASGAPAWVSVSSGSGSGTGEVVYTVQSNSGASPRSGSIAVGGQSHSINQEAAAPTCTYSIDPSSRGFGAGGGEGRFTVNTQAGCSWNAGGAPPWISVTSGSGNGPGEVVYTVQSNSGTSPRSGSIAVGGQSHSVNQEAAAPTCTYSLDPGSRGFGAGGGEGRFTVNTQAGCSWSASGAPPWVSVSAGSGSGPGEVVYTVQSHSGTSPRSGSISVGGQSHGINQDAAAPTCTYSLQPSSRNFGASGGQGTFDVVTQAGCTWSAQSGAGWVSVSSGSGNGPGQVAYAVQGNTATSTRSTTISVGGQTHTVTQDSAPPPCTYNVSPGSQNFPAGGGSGRFSVATASGCSWSASSGASWVSVTTPSGNGPGDVTYTVQANPSSTPRQTTITVNGQQHSVNQEAAAAPPPPQCTYAIDSSGRNFGSGGGEGVVRVTTGPTCTWSASSPAGWVTLSSSGGTGPGEVRYQVARNTNEGSRSTTLNIAGQAHRVQQEGEDDDDD